MHDDEFERLPPHDLPAEQSVLGGMLLSADIIPDVLERLTPADFYRPAHQVIYETIRALFAVGEPVDPITVTNRLAADGALKRVGEAGYLHTLIASVVTPQTSLYHTKSVLEKAVSRRLVESGMRIMDLGYAPGDSADKVDRAQADVLAINSELTRDGLTQVAEIAPGMLEEIEAAGAQDPGDSSAVPIPLKDLDFLLNGLRPGQLIVIGARPAVGKSVGALDFVRHAAIRHERPAVLFSLEMGRTEIVKRLFAAEARVPLNVINSGQLEDDDWQRIAGHMSEVISAPIWIDDTPGITVASIRAKARQHKARHGLQLLVVDYLQLMEPVTRSGSRQIDVAEMSRQLKLISKELEVPVVALSQLNRGPEQRQDKKPMLSDLRESGAVEQDSDVVILLHREDAYEKESPRAGEADWIVAKNRNGPTATITCAFQGHYARFVDMAPA